MPKPQSDITWWDFSVLMQAGYAMLLPRAKTCSCPPGITEEFRIKWLLLEFQITLFKMVVPLWTNQFHKCNKLDKGCLEGAEGKPRFAGWSTTSSSNFYSGERVVRALGGNFNWSNFNFLLRVPLSFLLHLSLLSFPIVNFFFFFEVFSLLPEKLSSWSSFCT